MTPDEALLALVKVVCRAERMCPQAVCLEIERIQDLLILHSPPGTCPEALRDTYTLLSHAKTHYRHLTPTRL